MKKAIMYGAGNIGRGFIGQLLSESGYEVVFIDVDEPIVDKLNHDKSYPIKFVSDKENHEIIIKNVRAVSGRDLEQIAVEISEAHIMATAVGVNILPRIAAPIAGGLSGRWKKKNMDPLNIIICENLMNANHYLKELIKKELGDEEKVYLDNFVGFVEASIGRMVPVVTPEKQEGNILRVCVEEYAELPVDKDGFKGEIPSVKNMIPFSPFELYIHRKLYIHNMGHALTAYLGFMKGYQFIWEAIIDPPIAAACRAAMMESARALSIEHGADIKELHAFVENLIERFGNQQLGDTIERVGRDLARKLSPNDRMIGAVNMCRKNGIEPQNICFGIAAALHFKDSVTNEVSVMLSENKIEEVLLKTCGITKDSEDWKEIVSDYQKMNAEI